MPKRAKAPSGFYTASEVMRKLGIGNSTLYHYVEQGKIKRVVPPDRKDGYYIKADIDKMVRAKELFILQYSSSSSEFMKASEEDIQGIYDLCVSLYGATNIPSYERRMDKDSGIYYVVKQDGIVTGFVSLLSTLGEPVDNLYITTGIRPGLDLRLRRRYGSRLLTGAIDVLEDFAQKGMPVKKLYATSRTTEGTKLCYGLGFKETQLKPEDDMLHFELDLETSDSPFLKKYQQAIKRRARKTHLRDVSKKT